MSDLPNIVAQVVRAVSAPTTAAAAPDGECRVGDSDSPHRQERPRGRSGRASTVRWGHVPFARRPEAVPSQS
jgi:hypothetical protein